MSSLRTAAKDSGNKFSNGPSPDLKTFPFKLGWIQGVLIPCLLNIWGVMLFLRIAWVVAQAGIALSLVIIAIAAAVCIITTLSLSAICTNGQVEGGGVYYLISRALGAPFGAPVGIIFAFANAVAASMNTIGFCLSLNDLLRRYGVKVIDNDVNDIRLFGTIAILIMCVICAIGMDWETKTQNFLIVVILLAIANFYIGVIIGPKSDNERAQGYIGISGRVAKTNWGHDFRFSEGTDQNFFSVFSIYFPAVTGVQAGANICGDLKDPASAIPKGTILAVFISSASYAIMAVLSGSAALRDASGNTTSIGNFDDLASCKPNCVYGLHNNYEIMQLMAGWDLLIFFGCWAATLSTALTNLLAVPRLIQALGKDRIYPGLIYFSKPYGKHGEPYRGYVLTFIVSTAFLVIADLNKVAPLITNFYLASYALINFCAFYADFVKHINWRPQFKWYNKWLSLFGFFVSVTIMIMISWVMALVTILIFLTLYLLVHYRDSAPNWGTSSDAVQYRETVSFLLKQTITEESVKSYNPQILVLTGKPFLRASLIEMANLITKQGSFMIAADIEQEVYSVEERLLRTQTGQNWLSSRKYRAFYVFLDGHDIQSGLTTLLQTTGLGKLCPNILMIGFPRDWQSKSLNKLLEYVLSILSVDSNESLTQESSHNFTQELLLQNVDKDKTSASKLKEPDHNDDGRIFLGTVLEITKLRVDVWWLYDDGGLNILIPYLISRRGFKGKIALRIFVIAKKNVVEAKKKMQETLQKIRIEYDYLNIIESINKAPRDSSWDVFNAIVSKFKASDQDKQTSLMVTDEELRRLHYKTSRHLRLRELILDNSVNSTLVTITLPLPRKIDSDYGTVICVVRHALGRFFEMKKSRYDCRVQLLESWHNASFKAFVVRFPTQKLDIFMKEDFWPKGVVYRHFRGRVPPTTTGTTSATLNASTRRA